MVAVVVWWLVWRGRNNKVFENATEPLYQVYRRAKSLLLFWAKRCKECDNDHSGGLIRDWDGAIEIG